MGIQALGTEPVSGEGGLVTGRLESGLRNRKLVFIIYFLYLNFTKPCAYSTFSTFTHAIRIKISLKTCTELNNKT